MSRLVVLFAFVVVTAAPHLALAQQGTAYPARFYPLPQPVQPVGYQATFSPDLALESASLQLLLHDAQELRNLKAQYDMLSGRVGANEWELLRLKGRIDLMEISNQFQMGVLAERLGQIEARQRYGQQGQYQGW